MSSGVHSTVIRSARAGVGDRPEVCTEVCNEVCKRFTHFDGRPPPPALGFRCVPEPDYPPPT